MLRFDGINPYNLPMEYLRLAANLLIYGWVAYQVGSVIWGIIKSVRETRATRKRLEAIEAEIMSERIAEVARMNKASRIELEAIEAEIMSEALKWGFRDPVIIKGSANKRQKSVKK